MLANGAFQWVDLYPVETFTIPVTNKGKEEE